MRKFWKIAAVLAISTAFCCSACNLPEENTKPVFVNSTRPDHVFVQKITLLTEIMSQETLEPSVVLQNLRRFIAENQEEYSKALAELNDILLKLQDKERENFKKEASQLLNASLEAFGYAQMRLRGRMNDAEKVELSEVLTLLR